MSARREGDTVVLANDRVSATIDAAGAIAAFGPGGGGDPVQISVAAGVLARDAFGVERIDVVDDSPARVAVELTGGLTGSPDVRLITRYELRPCEDGLRVRSELDNRSADVQTYALADVAVWRSPPPPLDGLARGAYATVVVAREAAAYAFASCESEDLHGSSQEQVSVLGTAPALMRPGERLRFERLILTAGDEAGAEAAIARVLGR